MMCCVCSGSCCHTGPHSYCAAHSSATPASPNGWIWYTPPTTNVPMYVQPCEHCYCDYADRETHPGHMRCCKCLTVMHRQFVKYPVLG